MANKNLQTIKAPMPTESSVVDVAIIGAGIVGLAAGVALKSAGYAVTIVDAQPQSQPQAEAKSIASQKDWDSRVYALSPSNIAWLIELGVWQYVVLNRVAEMRHMSLKFVEYTPSGGLNFSKELQPLVLSAEEANQAHLGCIIEARHLKQALMMQLAALGVPALFNTRCERIDLSASHDAYATLSVRSAENTSSIAAKLLIGADGAQSWVRSTLNIGLQKKAYAQTAILANFIVEKPHGDVAYQWFYTKALSDAATTDQSAIDHRATDESIADGLLTRNAILAWLPLPSQNNVHRISIVWSLANEDAAVLMQMPEETFTLAVQAAGEQTLGKMQLEGIRVQHPLSFLKADVMTQGNAILMGDAAHTIHPMAGQGMNLGLRDVKELMTVLAAKQSVQAINDAQLLKAYTRKRKCDVLNMQLLTDGLFELMANEVAPLKKVRQWGFSATKMLAIKRLLVSNATQY